MTWNTLITWSPSDVLGAADLNNNFDNVQMLYSMMPIFADGRLTLSSGVPLPTADVSAASTLYYTPTAKGNKISIYDGTSWTLNSFTELSISLSSIIKHVTYDVFVYLSGGTLTLELLAWKKVTATNSPTSGASKTINMSDTGDLAIGREVTVKDGTNSEVAVITAVVANTSITVANLSNGYTLPDIYGFFTRATALTTQNGVYVKSGSTGRRYVGTIGGAGANGQSEDSKARRLVWNYYNRERRSLYCFDTTDSWTYTAAALRPANNNTTPGTGRVEFVVGVQEAILSLRNSSIVVNSTASVHTYCPIGIDVLLTSSSTISTSANTNSASITFRPNSAYDGQIGIGLHYAQRLEGSGAAGSTTWYGDQSGTYFDQTGMSGWVDG